MVSGVGLGRVSSSQSQSQQWLRGWVPQQACGACNDRSTQDALGPLLEAADQGTNPIALDCQRLLIGAGQTRQCGCSTIWPAARRAPCSVDGARTISSMSKLPVETSEKVGHSLTFLTLTTLAAVRSALCTLAKEQAQKARLYKRGRNLSRIAVQCTLLPP